jgi:DtxR family Mn-dependent transcriptional regulator
MVTDNEPRGDFLKKLTESAQDYLRALLELSENGRPVHSSDVANTIGVSRASVSRAMDVLKDSGYITKEKYGTISLTNSGIKASKIIKKRNEMLTAFMTDILGVGIKMAKKDACLMEHAISAETTFKLAEYLENYSR